MYRAFGRVVVTRGHRPPPRLPSLNRQLSSATTAAIKDSSAPPAPPPAAAHRPRLFAMLDARKPLTNGFSSSAITSSTPITSPADLDALSQTDIENRYRPFLCVENSPPATGRATSDSIASAKTLAAAETPNSLVEAHASTTEPDWIDELEVETVTAFAALFPRKIKLLVLYGSLRERSFSRLTAYEASRILLRLGADVRVFDPFGLPIKDDRSEKDPKVVELRAMSEWSDGMLWVSPEQHGTITAVMKNQIDWIPLSTGSVRPTQGRTLAVCQVNGGSQSFNTVNQLRQLGRWMRMWTIPNQSSIPTAWKAYTADGRLIPSSNRDRLVDVCEELVKATVLLLPHKALLDDRFSERKERVAHGRLRTQAETETAKARDEKERRRVMESAKNGSETA